MYRLMKFGLASMIGLATLLLLAAAPADAHAYLSTSNPGDGAVLGASPQELQLGFSESVVLGATSLQLVDDHGVRYQLTNLRIVSSSGDGDPEEPVTLFATLPRLPHSAYRLSWSTLSRDDMHRTSGVVVFGVGQAVVAAGSHEPRPPQDEVALRWVLFTGFALALGGLLAARLISRRAQDLVAAAGCYRFTVIAASSTAGAAAALLVIQAGAAGIGTVLIGRYGEGWLTREIGLAMLATIAAARWRRPGAVPTLFRLVAISSILAVAAGSALVGHSRTGGVSYLVADALHLLATAAWVGCPAVLLVIARRRPATLRAALLGFARPATGCVAAIVVTGLYLSSGVVGSVDAAIATFYGRALLIKIALFAVVAGLGLLNFQLLRRQPVVPVRRTVLAEVVAAVLVLGLAAVLTSSQPAREPEFRQVATTATTEQDGLAADLQQTLSIKPNRPGRNVVLVRIFDTRRPAPGEITQVLVQITDASGAISPPASAESLPDRTWSLPIVLETSGRSTVLITVVRAGTEPVRSNFSWTVQAAPQAHRAVLLSQQPIRSPLQKLAISTMCLAAAAGLIAWRRRGANPSTSKPPGSARPAEQLVSTESG